jgi:DNA-directed RNA polymerase specialized sigma24 family protein
VRARRRDDGTEGRTCTAVVAKAPRFFLLGGTMAVAGEASPRGIDVAAKHTDIRRIVLKHFHVAGVHPDDLVQEVLAGILRRNQLPRSAYDPSRAAFSTYVYLVAHNVSARLARKEQRQHQAREAVEQTVRAFFQARGERWRPHQLHGQ